MGFWDAIVLIVLIVAIASIRHAKHRGAGSSLAAPEAGDRALEREVVELRKRIAVLERIATDERKGREIAAEIDALRTHDRD